MPVPFYKKPLALAVGLATVATVLPAYAQDATAPKNDTIVLEEIVVTAQKREQNMQDTPISMAAFDAQKLQAQGIGDISDAAQYVPNLMAVPSPGGTTGATIGIRGSVTINPAITWEPTVGMYVDGVFVAKNMGGLFDVTELDRIEVLRGPQGTLYGKNTIGGAINLITKKPAEEFGGKVRVKAGNYNYSDVYASVDSGKLGNVVSLNFALDKQDRDGFYKNTVANRKPGVAKRFGDLDSSAGRFAALFDITDDLSLYYTFDYSDKDNTPAYGQFDALGSDEDRRYKDGALDNAYYDKSRTLGHAVHITWNINDDLTFKSITAYRSMDFKDLNDYDGFDQTSTNPQINGTAYGVNNQFEVYRHFSTDQYTQEFQIVGHSDIADYVAGLYFLKENTDAKNNFDLGFPGTAIGGTCASKTVCNLYGVDDESVALFGQADWKLTEALTLTTGLRWTREEKKSYIEHNDGIFDAAGTPPGETVLTTQGKIRAKDHWDSVTPMATLSYLFENGINTYIKVAKGWKSGGFNGEALTVEGFEDSYKPEQVTSYEIGMKSRFLDNRIQLNAAIFHNRIKDMQISDLSSNAVYSTIRNAGKAIMQGLELDFAAQIIEGLSLNASYSYLDTRYKEYDAGSYGHNLTGKPEAKFPYAPRHNATVGLEYKTHVSVGELVGRLDYSATSGYDVFDNPTNAAATHVKNHGVLNGRLAIAEMNVGDNQSLEVGIWGKNLTDEQYRTNGLPAANGSGAVVGGINYYGDPRTFGADVTYKF